MSKGLHGQLARTLYQNIYQNIYQNSGLPSRKKPPLGPFASSVRPR